MGASQITKPKMEQTNSRDSGRGPTGGGQCQCKETKEKSQGQNHFQCLGVHSSHAGGCFVAVSNTLATAMFIN